MLVSLQYPKKNMTKPNRKVVFSQLQELNHLKRIVFCMVITFVFTMKARFVKIYKFPYIYHDLYSDFVIE